MSHSQAVHPTALLRRLLRAQLRLKVMAGVVVVTLLALVAFDVGAVATMRRYLLTQTDDNLHGPNEKFSLADFHRGIKSSAHLMAELAR